MSIGDISNYYDGEGNLVREYDHDTRTFTDHLTETSRAYTAEENEALNTFLAKEAARDRAGILEAKVDTALEANSTWLQRTGSPTNLQVLNQIDSLTRQVNGLLRVTLNRLSSLDGT